MRRHRRGDPPVARGANRRPVDIGGGGLRARVGVRRDGGGAFDDERVAVTVETIHKIPSFFTHPGIGRVDRQPFCRFHHAK